MFINVILNTLCYCHQDPLVDDIVWTGEDKAISKVISCTEIMKRGMIVSFNVIVFNVIFTGPA